MKFRGKLVDIGCIQQFTRILATISRLIKNCVLRITHDKLYFILSEQVTTGGIQMWCELPQGHFFDEFAMEGVTPESNEIYLELVPDNLLKALKNAQNAKWVKIKLTKKQTPCLTVEIDLPTVGSYQRQVVHDIPVHVVARRHWQDFEEPEMPVFDVSIGMPPLKVVRNIVEKMKNLSNFMVLSANRSGEMKLMVETDMASVTTHFQDLPKPVWRRDGQGEESQVVREDMDSQEFSKARIDIRKFVLFLSGQQVNPSRVVCNIVHKKLVHFFLMQDDVSLQYFMPVVHS